MALMELVVDLSALARNLKTMQDRGGGRAIFFAVKANAYGHGLVPVAKRVSDLVTGFAVATVGEAITLRQAGIKNTILKLSPVISTELPAAISADLTLVVGYLAGIEDIAAAARNAGKTVDVHLKIDTGMGRVGVRPEEAKEAALAITKHPELRLRGVMTHLAIADVADGREFTRKQLDLFHATVSEVRQVCPVEWVHAGNSAGILNHDLGEDNAIRPGIAVYGSPPELNLDEVDLLEPVATWSTKVTQVKWVSAGESVSYGRTWRAPVDTKVATVAAGYGDGYSRRNSSRGRVLIAGRSYPVVGRVCMDQFLVDVGHDDVHPGDTVVLLGASGQERITTGELADIMDTISYEVTCLITERVPRRYIG